MAVVGEPSAFDEALARSRFGALLGVHPASAKVDEALEVMLDCAPEAHIAAGIARIELAVHAAEFQGKETFEVPTALMRAALTDTTPVTPTIDWRQRALTAEGELRRLNELDAAVSKWSE